MREDEIDRAQLTASPFTPVMGKLVTQSTLSARSFITPALPGSITTALTMAALPAVVKLRVWLPRLTCLSPVWSVFRTKRCDRGTRRWLAAGRRHLSAAAAAASLPYPRPPGSSGGEAEVGAVEERTVGCRANGFLSAQLLRENQAAPTRRPTDFLPGSIL